MFVLCAALAAGALRPNILFVLVDDYGWADSDWHRAPGYNETATPFMLGLVESGIELDRHYAYKFCSPSRSAIQSGRSPIHVNVQNLDPFNVNPLDPDSGFSGVARNMTCLGALMKSAGYSTHMFGKEDLLQWWVPNRCNTGKWDAGMATPDHTPRGRGYDSSLIYFHHFNDYW
jgi:arylsulfatase I/J